MNTMAMLNYGWRKYVSSMMGLEANFQLAQGTLGLQTSDDSGLFLMADAVPPVSDVNLYDAGSTNKRSSAYLELLCALLPETNPNGLSQALGSQYAAWTSWRTKNRPQSEETYLDYFCRWGLHNIDPGILAQAKQRIEAAQNTPLLQAFEAYRNPAGRQSFGEETLPKYTTTRQRAVNALADGGSKPKIIFDSDAMVDRLGGMNRLGAEAGAMASGSGDMSFFYGAHGPLVRGLGAENALTLLNAKASTQRVTITGRIGSYATLTSNPGSWYTSAEVKRAFDGRGNREIWDPGAAAGNWDSFFDPKSGSLARYVSQLVLISDYEMTVKIHGRYTETDVNRVRDEAIGGAWPLFSAAGAPTQNIDYQRGSGGSIEVVNKLDPGKIQIWGVTLGHAP